MNITIATGALAKLFDTTSKTIADLAKRNIIVSAGKKGRWQRQSPPRNGKRLREPMTDLEIEVQDGDIIVTLPNTSYTVTYYKPKNSPQLLAKRIPNRDDPLVAMTLSEFLSAAWRLANNKARELGWVV